MDTHLEGARCRREVRQRPGQIVREGRLRELIDGRNRVDGRRGIGGVGLDQQRRTLAADQRLEKSAGMLTTNCAWPVASMLSASDSLRASPMNAK
jgi:hypothetical protein